MASYGCLCFLRKGRKGREAKGGSAKGTTVDSSHGTVQTTEPASLKSVPSTTSIGNFCRFAPEQNVPSPQPHTSPPTALSAASKASSPSTEAPRTPPPLPARASEIAHLRPADSGLGGGNDDDAHFMDACALSATSYSSSYYSACGWSHYGDGDAEGSSRRISSVGSFGRALLTQASSGAPAAPAAAAADPHADGHPPHHHQPSIFHPHRPSRGSGHLPVLREAALPAEAAAQAALHTAVAVEGFAASLEQPPSSLGPASSSAVAIMAQASRMSDALPSPAFCASAAPAADSDSLASAAAAVASEPVPLVPPPSPLVPSAPASPSAALLPSASFQLPPPLLPLPFIPDAYTGPVWTQDAGRSSGDGGSYPVSGGSGSIVVQHPHPPQPEEDDPHREALLDRVAELYGKLGRPCLAFQALLRFCKARGVQPESLAAGLAARRVPNAALLPKVLRNVCDSLADLRTEDHWQLMRNDDLRMLYKHLADKDVHAFRAVCTLDAPMEKLVALARELDLFPTWNKYCTSAKVLRESTPADMRVYVSLWMPWPFSDVGFCVDVNGLDLFDDEGCIVAAICSPDRKDRTTPLPPGSEKHTKIRLLRPSCLTFTPLPPKTPGGTLRTHCHVQAYVDTGGKHVPAVVISFVLKVFSPFIYGTVKKVLASAFGDPRGPLPSRMREQPHLYDMVRRRSEAYLAARKAAGAAGAGMPQPPLYAPLVAAPAGY
ncbi:hypothetical protein Agub_g13566 [Astrephomene gubernaculifera]|uniref:START domain-containing protein n=1 Tax=Astrephomene gubernaculifera TaxID=47775 RepID=A0AAD3HRL4_9CHLO|nr:hypothetical protein Agub_g13566 [Astrephomene gubernaculifera]